MLEVLSQPAADKLTCHFPDDVLIEIFVKLPVRSLFLFRSVSKHWLSLIQNPHFIKLHNNRLIDISHESMLILRSVEHERDHDFRSIILTLLSDDETLAYKDDVASGLVSPSMTSRGLDSQGYSLGEDSFHLMGPCNGLFCITDTVDAVLFNPAIRECRIVTLPALTLRDNNCYYMDYKNPVGFGFDSISDEYKVVQFASVGMIFDYDTGDDDVDENEEYANFHNDLHFKVAIFSLRTNCWGETASTVQTGGISTIYNCNLFFNGGFHWLGGDFYTNSSWIFVFDLHKEAWKRFELPDGYLEDEDDLFKLSVMNDSLATIVYTSIYDLISGVEFKIWVMMEYGLERSWTKLYSISDVMEIERPLSFGNNEEFLLENKDGQLVSFNLNTREIKEFQVHGVPGSMHAFRYRESLVPLN